MSLMDAIAQCDGAVMLIDSELVVELLLPLLVWVT